MAKKKQQSSGPVAGVYDTDTGTCELVRDTLTADEAERMGLVAYRCGDDELRDKALELGAKLAAKPPQALQYTKQLTRHGADAIREQIKKESVLFAERMFSDETRAIFDKFLNKK